MLVTYIVLWRIELGTYNVKGSRARYSYKRQPINLFWAHNLSGFMLKSWPGACVIYQFLDQGNLQGEAARQSAWVPRRLHNKNPFILLINRNLRRYHTCASHKRFMFLRAFSGEGLRRWQPYVVVCMMHTMDYLRLFALFPSWVAVFKSLPGVIVNAHREQD